VKEAQGAAQSFGTQFQSLVIASPDEIEGAFSAMVRERGGALVVQPLFVGSLGQGRRIADLAVQNRLPTVSDLGTFADAGGLISYGRML
jgi:putative tryptophan/tyrosine transport system substrate-binding protein